MLGMLFLLLPVAAAYGWYMGQRSARKSVELQEHRLSSQYVTGLDMLLSNQSDKAIDHFIDLLQDDADTIDTHLALGNLFRQRGEVDRAIRIHQNLISRENLSVELRNLAIQQLGKDYLAAGLLDRAEALFLQLLEEPESEQLALKQLLSIYQQLRDWQKAIDVAKRMSSRQSKALRRQIAHFYCELAHGLEVKGQYKAALSQAKKALLNDEKCVRASLLMASVHRHLSQYDQALKSLESVPNQDPQFISETLLLYRSCCEQIQDQQRYFDFLQANIGQGDGQVLVELAKIYHQREGSQRSQKLIIEQLRQHPNYEGFHQLMTYFVDEAENGPAKQSLATLKVMVEEQMKSRAHYLCRRCGFSSHSLYWHCPSCKEWGSVKPILGIANGDTK